MVTRRQRTALVAGALVLMLTAGRASAEVVVVVSTASPVESLTSQQLIDIYLARRDHLPGGHMVQPVDQREGAAAHDGFYDEYIGRSPAQIKAHWSKLVFTGRGRPPRSAHDGAEVADVVAANPHAIGYLERDQVDERLRVVRVERR